jgi:hypothetical protein
MNYTMEPAVRKMTQPQVLESQWEEILARHGAQLAGQKVKIYVEPDEAEAAAQHSHRTSKPFRRFATSSSSRKV